MDSLEAMRLSGTLDSANVDMLQRAATRCNALQRAATHYNMF